MWGDWVSVGSCGLWMRISMCVRVFLSLPVCVFTLSRWFQNLRNCFYRSHWNCICRREKKRGGRIKNNKTWKAIFYLLWNLTFLLFHSFARSLFMESFRCTWTFISTIHSQLGLRGQGDRDPFPRRSHNSGPRFLKSYSSVYEGSPLIPPEDSPNQAKNILDYKLRGEKRVIFD